MTGDYAAYGKSHVQAALMAKEEINGAGGINGVPIEIVVEDEAMTGDGAIAALTKLSAQGIPVILGCFGSSLVLASCKRYAEQGVVLLTSSSNVRIHDECGDWIFQWQGLDDDYARYGYVDVVEKLGLGINELAFVYTNTDYGAGVEKTFREVIESKGGKLLLSVPLQAGGKDYRAEITKLKAAKPKIIAFAGYETEATPFFKQVKELGLQAQWVGGEENIALTFGEALGDAVEGLVGIKIGNTKLPQAAKFVQNYAAKYTDQPMYGADSVYDGIHVLAKAIAQGGYTGAAIRDTIPKVAADYVGASGPKKVGTNNASPMVFQYLQWKGGKLVDWP